MPRAAGRDHGAKRRVNPHPCAHETSPGRGLRKVPLPQRDNGSQTQVSPCESADTSTGAQQGRAEPRSTSSHGPHMPWATCTKEEALRAIKAESKKHAGPRRSSQERWKPPFHLPAAPQLGQETGTDLCDAEDLRVRYAVTLEFRAALWAMG